MRFKNILKPPHLKEGYKIMPPMDKEKYPEMPGLEGPFTMMSGKVVYYDPKEGAYYDKDTDMYMSYDEFQQHDNDYSNMKDERDEVKKEADELNIGAKGDRPYKAPRQPKRGDPINPKSKGVDPKVLNMFLTNGVSENVAVRRDGKTLSKGEKAKLQRQGVLMKEGDYDQDTVKKNALEALVDIAKTAKKYKGGVTDEQIEILGGLIQDMDLAGIEPEKYSAVNELFKVMATDKKADMTMIQPAYAQVKQIDEGAPKSSPRPKPRPKTMPRPKARPTTNIGGMPGGSTRGIDPKDNYSPEDLKRLLMQSAMEDMNEGEEGMIVYVGDQKFEYADYTIQDAMRIVDEYADEMEGEPYEVYNADGELVASGTMRSGAFHEPGIEEGHSPHKKGTKKYKAHMAAMHANSVDLNAMRDALKLDERTDANTVVAQYTRACLDHRHNTWGKVCEQIDHVRSFVKEDVDVNNVRLQIRKMHKQEGLDRKIQIKENVDKLRQIVKDKSAMSIKFSDGSMKVDMTTASIFLQIFDKVKEETQEKIVDKIQTKSGFLSMLEMMYKKIG